jgi:hypothetical protein
MLTDVNVLKICKWPILFSEMYMHRKRAISVGDPYMLYKQTYLFNILQIVREIGVGAWKKHLFKRCLPDQSLRL